MGLELKPSSPVRSAVETFGTGMGMFVLGDARDVLRELPDNFADCVVTDPPYEERDFKVYGQTPFNKPQVIKDLGEIMPPGSYLAWLDVTVPMYSKKLWTLLGHIGLVVSTNTRVRMWTLLERVNWGV